MKSIKNQRGMIYMELSSAFFKNSERLLNKDEIESVLLEDSTFFIEYVETMWLNRYFKVKALSTTTSIPSITSTISDIPSSGLNLNNSKTEKYALKSSVANDWILFFHEKLNLLPSELKKLIQLKYLNRSSDGRFYDDGFVYNKMNISRAQYYRMKKDALEELGRLLYASNDSHL